MKLLPSLSKVRVGSIILNHFKTLANHNTKKFEWDDIFTFFVTPAIASALLVCLDIELSDNATNIIITTLSILVGLLFNVIVIIFDIIKRDATKELKNEVLNQLLTNISYAILLSIFIIAITLFTYIEIKIVEQIASAIVYFLIGNFFLTVLMILKRMYLLFTNELNEIENEVKK